VLISSDVLYKRESPLFTHYEVDVMEVVWAYALWLTIFMLYCWSMVIFLMVLWIKAHMFLFVASILWLFVGYALIFSALGL
jgi:hypothetical protein